MNEKQNVIASISIPPTATIRRAMEVMTRAPKRARSNPAGIVLVVDGGWSAW